MRRGLTLGASIAMSGCALALSTSDYTSGSKAADGGAEPFDAMVEAEATPLRDASTDAALESAPFCSNRDAGAFCQDFDEGPFDKTVWSDTEIDTGVGSLVVDTSSARSGVGSLFATTTKSSIQYPSAFVEHLIGNVATGVHTEGDIFIDYADANTIGGRVFGLKAGVNLLLSVRATGAIRVEENWADGSGTLQFAYHGASTIQLKTWFHVDVDLDVGSKTVTVMIDGRTITDGTPLMGPFSSAQVGVVVGLYHPETDVDMWQAHFDNILATGE